LIVYEIVVAVFKFGTAKNIDTVFAFFNVKSIENVFGVIDEISPGIFRIEEAHVFEKRLFF